MSAQIQEAIVQIKSGHKKAAKAILLELIKEDATNSAAWLCLSAAVHKAETRRTCLEKAILYDPDNTAAQQALAKLNEKYPPPVVETAVIHENIPLEEVEAFEDEEMWLPDSFKPISPIENQATMSTIDKDRQQKEAMLEAIVVRRLGKFHRPKDIAEELAKRNVDYNEALRFTLAVGKEKQRQIAIRRVPISLMIIAITFIMGVVFLFSRFSLYFGWPMIISSFVGVFIMLKDIIFKK